MGKAWEVIVTTPHFLIAKYAPDVRRMEPRNCGIIVWNHGAPATKFIPDNANGLRRLHLNNKQTYEQWIAAWSKDCQQKALRRKNGKLVSRESPEFLDALRETGKGNFLLVTGGQLMDLVDPSETGMVAADLFEELVFSGHSEESLTEDVPHGHDHTEAQLLYNTGRRVIRQAGLHQREGFTSSGYDCPIMIGNTQQFFHFDCGIHIQKPLAVIQRVSLRKQVSVFDAVFKFREMQKEYLKPNDCAAMVFATDDDLRDADVREAYRLLQATGRIVNVANEDEAENSLRSLAL